MTAALIQLYQKKDFNVAVYALFIGDVGKRDTRDISKIMSKAADLTTFW